MNRFLVFLSFVILLAAAFPMTTAAQTTILSNGSGGGDWASASTWAGFVVPTTIDTVLIQGGDSVTVSSDTACHTLNMEAESKLGLADTIVVEDFLGYGAVTAHAGGRLRIDSSGTFGLDAVYEHARDGGSLPVATWQAGSTCMLTGLTGSAPSNGNQSFYHFTWNNPSQSAGLNLAWNGITIGGNLTCMASGSSQFRMASNNQNPMAVTIDGDVIVTGGALTATGSGTAATYAITVNGNVNVTGGNLSLSRGSGGVATWYLYGDFSISNATLQTSNSSSKYVFSRPGTQLVTLTNVTYTSANNMEVAAGTTVDFGTNQLRGSGAFTLNGGAKLATGHFGGVDSTLRNTGTKALNAGAGYIFNGSVAQATGLTLPAVVGKLTINNANGVTLSDTVRVDSTLIFTSGILTTGANLLEIGTEGAVERTSGHVDGLLRKTMLLGADTKTFEIGDATVYAPVDVAGASYAGDFAITATTTSGDHGSLGSSGLDASKSVNRVYTLTGTPTGSSDMTFHFDPADLDAGINPQNLKIGKYDGSWSLPALGTKTSTSTQATGISSLSDFVVAQLVPLKILSNGTGGGTWASASTWQGGVVPSAIDTAVILTGDSVGVGTNADVWTLEMQSGSKFGLGDTFSTAYFQGLGTVTANAASRFRIDSSGTFGNGSVYNHALNGGSLPTATWAAGSTCMLTGITANSPSNAVQNFYNFVWNNTLQSGNLNLAWTGITIGGDLTVMASGASSRFQMASNTQSPMTVTINGDVIVTGGALTSNGSSGAGTYAVTVNGDVIVTGGNLALSRGSGGIATWYLYGNFSVANATLQTSNSASKFVFSKAGTQTVALTNVTFTSANNMEVAPGTTVDFGTSQLRGSGAFTLNADAALMTGHFGGLDSTLLNTGTKTLNPGAGYIFNGGAAQVTGATFPAVVGDLTFDNANGVTLSDTVRADSTLTLISGIVTTGANVLELGPNGTSGRTSGHVNGLLLKTMASGADSKTFEIGDASLYTPVDVAGASYAGAFGILATTTPGDHFDISNSGLLGTKSANRVYTLTGTPTGSSDITFTFDPSDVDGGADPASFKVGKYDGSWSLPSVGTVTPTSTQATGISSLSDFILAQSPATLVLSNGTGGGDWTSTATWQGGIAPTSLDSVIILGGDSVYVPGGGASATGLQVAASGILSLVDTLNVAYSTVSGKVVAHVGGRFSVDSGAVFESTGLYQHNQNGGSLPVATWNTGSTLLLTGLTGNAPSNGSQNFHNVIWNNTAQGSNLNMGWNGITIGGNVTMMSSGAGTSRWQFCAPLAESTATVTLMGDVIVTGGQLSTNGTSNGNTTIVINHYGNVTVTGGNFSISRGSQGGTGTSRWYLYNGDFTMSNATTQNSNSAGGRFVFTKAGTQTLALSNVTFGGGGMPVIVESGTTLDVGSSVFYGSGAFTVEADAALAIGHPAGIDSVLQNTGTKTLSPAAGFIFNGAAAQATGLTLPAVAGDLTINNANGVTLSDTLRVDSTLTFTAGILATGVNVLEVGPAGTVSRTSGHVNGLLMKTMAAGADSKTFEVGDAAVYAPVDVTGAAYAGAFTITAATAAGDHGSIGSSGLLPTKSVNRFYTLTGSPTGSSDVTFNFAPSDVDPGASTGNFKIGKYDGAWTLPVVGARTATSTQATGVASLSDFIVAEAPPTTITSNGTGGGDWTLAGTWQGGVVPTSADSAIILGGDSVFVLAGGGAALGLKVDASGILALVDTLNAAYSTVAGKVVSHVGGRFSIDSGAVFAAGGLYQHDQNGGSLPIATWDSGSTILFTGVAGNSPSNGRQNFHDVVWNNTAQTANLNLGWNGNTIKGDITVLSTGTGRWQMCAPLTDSTAVVTLMGDVVMSAGNFTTNGTSNGGTTIVVNQYGSIVVTGGNLSISRGSQGGTGTARWYLHGGDFTMSDATTQNSNSTGGRFVFTKAGEQSLTLTNVTFGGGGMPIIVEPGTRLNTGTSMIRGSGAFTLEPDAKIETANFGGLDSTLAGTGTILLDTLASYIFDGSVPQVTGVRMPPMAKNLTFDNPAGVALTNTVIVAGELGLESGIVATAPNLIEVAPGGTVSRTSGHVNGVLRKTLGPGADSKTFEIGDAAVYAPVDITGSAYASAFQLGASTAPGDHANITSSVFDSALSVNRTWSFDGAATGSSDITFHFDAGDVDGGANTNNFRVSRYDGSWTLLGAGAVTSTSTQATGVTGFSDFQVGEEHAAFLAEYRSFTPPAIATDVDNKGKTGKYVKRKPVRVDFVLYEKVDSANITGLHIEFGLAMDTAFPYYSVPAAAWSNPDGKLKKWDLAFADTLNTGDTVFVYGYGNKGKLQKVMKYYWTRGGILTGLKLKGGIFTRNDPKLPMPNRINVLYETFEQGGFTATAGLLVGVPRLDSLKWYGWMQSPKPTDIVKTLSRKGVQHTGQPRGFDQWITLKPLLKLQKKIEVHKHNNALVAELATLKLNIASSMLGKTPVGFGELILDGDSVAGSPWLGYTVAQIAAAADTLMMGTWSGGVHVFADSATYGGLFDAVSRINAAFEGPIDTASFSASLVLTGTRSVLDVSHTLRPNIGTVPATLVPSAVADYTSAPESYALYQNYPNPFNPTTTIEFELPQPAFVTLKVYNLLGQEIATLFDREEMTDGMQEVEFDAASLPTGVYIYRLIADGIADEDEGTAAESFVSVKKMVLVK